MQNELNVPNVETRRIKAREWSRPNGHMHRVFDTPQPITSESLWQRIQRLFPHSEVLDVAGRQVNGFVIPHWAAGVLLAAILAGMGFLYSQNSGQRDMLIRLDTQLQERDKHELEYRNEFKTKLSVQELQIQNITSQYNVVKGLLTPQQLRYLEQNSRKVDN